MMGWLLTFTFIAIAAFSPAARSSDIYASGCMITAGLFALAGSISLHK